MQSFGPVDVQVAVVIVGQHRVVAEDLIVGPTHIVAGFAGRKLYPIGHEILREAGLRRHVVSLNALSSASAEAAHRVLLKEPLLATLPRFALKHFHVLGSQPLPAECDGVTLRIFRPDQAVEGLHHPTYTSSPYEIFWYWVACSPSGGRIHPLFGQRQCGLEQHGTTLIPHFDDDRFTLASVEAVSCDLGKGTHRLTSGCL